MTLHQLLYRCPRCQSRHISPNLNYLRRWGCADCGWRGFRRPRRGLPWWRWRLTWWLD